MFHIFWYFKSIMFDVVTWKLLFFFFFFIFNYLFHNIFFFHCHGQNNINACFKPLLQAKQGRLLVRIIVCVGGRFFYIFICVKCFISDGVENVMMYKKILQYLLNLSGMLKCNWSIYNIMSGKCYCFSVFCFLM